MVGSSLPLGLDQALSCDDGLRRIAGRMDEITPAIVTDLRDAAIGAGSPGSPTADAEAAADLRLAAGDSVWFTVKAQEVALHPAARPMRG